MENRREVYAHKALAQIPRLLGNLDRNPFSPTYGCFHRDYWLDKTSDFPDAVRQFGIHSLALVFAHDFPGNPYRGQNKIRDWAIAGMEFWAKIQHPNGSFDEFYPYEQGWAGPTAFTAYVVTESLKLLKDQIPPAKRSRIEEAIRKAAHFIASGESEEDHLANHHAIACLAVWKAYELFQDPALKRGFEKLWKKFLTYRAKEGWFREYDGVDPGYLSATVSFLGKIYQTHPSPEILEVAQSAVEFSSFFVYPNGFYAGSLGSRNTLHFYPHGFEIFAKQVPLAASVAEKTLAALGEGKLVPPEIMSDRYVFYRVPEFLQAYLDYTPRPAPLPLLPFERPSFFKFFPESKIWVRKKDQTYLIANLAKGGVLKIFNGPDGRLILNDCGIIGRLNHQKTVTSQWIDPAYRYKATEQGWEVSGNLHSVPGHRLFTPLKLILFRLLLLLMGWNASLAHRLKGMIRKMLILGARPLPIRFVRRLEVGSEDVSLNSEIRMQGAGRLDSLSFGDEFFVRYVPQSQYFQSQELEVRGRVLSEDELEKLYREGRFSLTSTCKLR